MDEDQLRKILKDELRQQSKRFAKSLDKGLNAQTLSFDKKLDERLNAQTLSFDKKLDERLNAQTLSFDKKLDERLNAQSILFDEKLNKQSETLNENLNLGLAQQFGHFERAIRKLSDKMATKRQFQQIQNTLDGIISRLDDKDNEVAVITNDIDHHDKWIGQLARRTGTKLVPER